MDLWEIGFKNVNWLSRLYWWW